MSSQGLIELSTISHGYTKNPDQLGEGLRALFKVVSAAAGGRETAGRGGSGQQYHAPART